MQQLGKTTINRFTVAVVLALSVLSGRVALGSTAAVFRVFESPVARFFFAETQEGMALMSRVAPRPSGRGQVGYSEFLEKIRNPQMASVRQELEATLIEARAVIDDFAEAGASRPRRTMAELTTGERHILRQLAARRLRLNPEFVEPGQIEFVSAKPSASYSASRNRLLVKEPIDPAFEAPTKVGTPEGQVKGLRRARQFIEDMNVCVKQRPPTARRNGELLYMFRSLAIGELFTVGGYVAGSGSKVVDWKNLPTDMAMTALFSFVGSKVIMGNTTFLMRWVRVVAWGETRAGVDAVFYYLTPFKDTHGVPVGEATKRRYQYNAVWNASNAITTVSIYTLLTGLECLYPGGKMVALTTGIQMSTSAATAFAYFRLRNHFTEDGPSSHKDDPGPGILVKDQALPFMN